MAEDRETVDEPYSNWLFLKKKSLEFVCVGDWDCDDWWCWWVLVDCCLAGSCDEATEEEDAEEAAWLTCCFISFVVVDLLDVCCCCDGAEVVCDNGVVFSITGGVVLTS